jgi:hypothetical protein
MAKNYYSAKDTTYNTWNDNQIKRWAISRGLIKSDTEKKRDECVGEDWIPVLFLLTRGSSVRNVVADKYYALRDSAWSAWDDGMVKHWLQSKGVIKGDYEAKRDESVPFDRSSVI